MQNQPISATILPFHRAVGASRGTRFSWRDRLRAAAWENQARRFGLARVVVEHGAEQGDFMLIYREGSPWAVYGVGLELDRYIVWQQATGATLGVFDELEAALAAVIGHRSGGSLPPQA